MNWRCTETILVQWRNKEIQIKMAELLPLKVNSFILKLSNALAMSPKPCPFPLNTHTSSKVITVKLRVENLPGMCISWLLILDQSPTLSNVQSSIKLPLSDTTGPWNCGNKPAEWMTCDFMSFSTIFQSYQVKGRKELKGCMQWSHNYFDMILVTRRNRTQPLSLQTCT